MTVGEYDCSVVYHRSHVPQLRPTLSDVETTHRASVYPKETRLVHFGRRGELVPDVPHTIIMKIARHELVLPCISCIAFRELRPLPSDLLLKRLDLRPEAVLRFLDGPLL